MISNNLLDIIYLSMSIYIAIGIVFSIVGFMVEFKYAITRKFSDNFFFFVFATVFWLPLTFISLWQMYSKNKKTNTEDITFGKVKVDSLMGEGSIKGYSNEEVN